MEQNVSRVKEPGTTKVATKQDKRESLRSNEQETKETVERFLQDESDKVQAEEESKREGKPLKPEEEGERPTAKDASKFTEKEQPGKKWEGLLLRDELPPFSEDEEEMEMRSDSPSLQDEAMEKKEEEDKEAVEEKITVRPPQSLWSQCRERLRSSLRMSSSSSGGSQSKQKLSVGPFGYFSTLANAFSTEVPLGQGKQMSDEEAQPQPQLQPQPQKQPMLARLFTFIISEDQTKKAVLRRPTLVMGENIASLPTTNIDEVQESQERRDSAGTEESKLEEDISSSPEIFPEVPPGPGPLPEDIRSEPPKKEAKRAEGSTKRRGAHKPKHDSLSSYSGMGSSVWSMGQHITHWKTAHHRGYHADQLTQDKIYKFKLLKHERDTKAAVPLPLQEVIEEEVLAILKATLVDYQEKLGPNNPLTIQMEAAVDRLHLQLRARTAV